MSQPSLDFDGSVLHFDGFLYDGEAEATALDLLRVAGAKETLEQARHVRVRDTDTAISNDEATMFVADRDLEVDLAPLRGVLERVTE